MGADGYVGTAQDSQRIRRQEKQREEQRKKFEEQQQQQREKVLNAGLKQFGSSTSEAYEAAFKTETVGLVTREEFMQKRNTIQQRLQEEEAREKKAAEAAAAAEKERRKRDKAKAKMKVKLSFIDDGDEEAGDEADAGAAPERTASGAAASTSGDEGRAPAAKRAKLGKDPTVRTDFLPDKDREAMEEELRQKLKQEWVDQQEAIKNEPLEVTYSYWDGSGHRRKIVVRKGDSIGGFLKAVRDQLAPEFREMRALGTDGLMYIKEDLILPHHHTFYELIINKARGKSGPLFDFGVTEDIRVVNDATVEKQDAHAGKVVDRHWYERNKHIFPASRWETFDPEKVWDTYTIHGGEVR